MRTCVVTLLVLLACSNSHAAQSEVRGAPASPPGSSAPTAYDFDSFRRELRELSVQLAEQPSAQEMRALRDSVPPSLTVSTPERTYSISTEPLRAQLSAGSREKAQSWVRHLREVIEGAEGPSANSDAARSQLNRILAAREFAAVRATPSAWDILRQRIGAWIDRLLSKFFQGMERHPRAGQMLFWLIVLGAVSFVALWVFRFLGSRDRMESLPSVSSLLTQRSWQEWLRAAREAAGRGDYREAIHSAYWACITRLEDLGAVPRDRTRTPREYVRAVTEAESAEPGSPPHRKEPLVALTSGMERTWYANRGAGPEDFGEALRQLEALGCPLD